MGVSWIVLKLSFPKFSLILFGIIPIIQELGIFYYDLV